MAIVVDARASGAQSFPAGASVTGATTMAWTHTLGVLTNGILIVSLAQDAAANTTSVVWDDGGTNIALARKGTVSQGSCRAEIWWVLTSGLVTGAKTIRATWVGSHEGEGGSASYSGVDPVTPFNPASPQTATGLSGTNPSLGVTTTAGELAIDSAVQDLATTGHAPTKGASQTYIAAGVNVNTTSIESGHSEFPAVGTTTTLTWTFEPSGGAWGQVGVSLRPFVGGGIGLSSSFGNPFHPGRGPLAAARFYVPQTKGITIVVPFVQPIASYFGTGMNPGRTPLNIARFFTPTTKGFTPPALPGTVVFRKTLSGFGSRVGSRQTHG
jgi:hypothetical protein